MNKIKTNEVIVVSVDFHRNSETYVMFKRVKGRSEIVNSRDYYPITNQSKKRLKRVLEAVLG